MRLSPWLRQALSWLPVAVLLVGAANHFWLRHSHISPWLGAGFGMFAATDADTSRRVYLFVRLENGIEHEIAIGEAFRDTLERARGLPTDAWLTRLAAVTLQAVEHERELDLSSRPVSLRVEIWRNSYRANTLQPRSIALVIRVFPFRPDDD